MSARGDNGREPWDRLPEETFKAYRIFSAFLELGFRRSVNKAYRVVYNHPEGKVAAPYVRDWAVKFRWRERAAAFDEHEERQRQLQFEHERWQARQRQLQFARMMQSKAAVRLHLIPHDDKTHKGIGDILAAMDVEEARRLIVAGMEAERKALGMDNEHKIEGRVEVVSTADIEAAAKRNDERIAEAEAKAKEANGNSNGNGKRAEDADE